jgi:hypothetical protein
MQRFSSFLCVAALALVALTTSVGVQAMPLIFEDDSEAAAEAEASRKRSVNILDTSGSNDTSYRTLQILRELQERRPGLTFSNQPGLSDGGGRMGIGNKGLTKGNLIDPNTNGPTFGDMGAGLFGSGLNAEAIGRERVPETMSDHAAGVRARPQGYVDPEAPDPNGPSGTPGGSYSVSGDSAAPMEQKPGLMSILFKLIREYRLAVIGGALMLLLLAVGASVSARR